MRRLQPIQIGPVRIETPVILAPMTGVTDMPFRRIVKRYGAGLTVTEMIASQAAIIEKRVDLASFKDPDKLQRFVQRFTAIWDAQNNAASAPILNLFADSSTQGLDASLLLSLQRIRTGN